MPLRTIEIRPELQIPGVKLTSETTEMWFSTAVHALNYAQDNFIDCEILVFHANGELMHRYSVGTED